MQTRSKTKKSESPQKQDVPQHVKQRKANTPLEKPVKQSVSKSKETKQSTNDMYNVVLLIVLYMLQGVPLGLTFGSVPFLLKSKLNYADLALFSLSSYPYSLKLFWSPIVDTLFFKSIGRRKSWILPIQLILGACLVLVGGQIDSMLEQPEIPVNLIAGVFTLFVFLCATQDIAVDGWALELLTDENKTYASTAQTIGLNTGYFVSFTIFLAFNSSEFCNTYIRSQPLDTGLLSLGQYLTFWGFAFLLCTLALFFFAKEAPAQVHSDEIAAVYKTIYGIMRMPHMTTLIVILFTAKIGFIPNEAVTGLKLLELGFNKEYLAAAAIIDFPLQLVFGYYAAKWSSGRRPLRPWLFAFWGRLLAAVMGMAVVAFYPKEGVTHFYFFLVMFVTTFSSFMSTVQFVGLGSFFTQISDPAIGGTYMTLLNTLSNLGGTWPKYFILLAVDWLTVAPCSVDANIKCTDEKAKQQCLEVGGKCSMESDGYYTVSVVCVVLGVLSMLFYIVPQVRKMEAIPASKWKLKKD
ncbi:acetyl-coenzyme A transporter 1-domain-containing protein [Gorgonomyces haynaldii]|nr:acetyl-coenzyme A transporter 1-domain-containing protein [Gorgonomyces haynaldii]